MLDELSAILEEAITKKREGDLESSLQCYLNAIDLDATYKEIYVGLGKTTYLLDNSFLSFSAYLSYMHLLMHELELQMENDVLPDPYEGFYQDLPEEVKGILPRKSGVLIFAEYNLTKHLGHTILDFDPDRPENTDGFVAIYRAGITGAGDYGHLYEEYNVSSEDIQKVEQEFYVPSAREFIVDFLEWDELADNDVVGIYFNEERAKERFGLE